MSARSGERKRLGEMGLQNTQRSWSNYAGDKPIKRLEGTDNYANSPYGPGRDAGAYQSSLSKLRKELEDLDEMKRLQREKDADMAGSEYQQLQRRTSNRKIREAAEKAAKKPRLSYDEFEWNA